MYRSEGQKCEDDVRKYLVCLQSEEAWRKDNTWLVFPPRVVMKAQMGKAKGGAIIGSTNCFLTLLLGVSFLAV